MNMAFYAARWLGWIWIWIPSVCMLPFLFFCIFVVLVRYYENRLFFEGYWMLLFFFLSLSFYLLLLSEVFNKSKALVEQSAFPNLAEYRTYITQVLLVEPSCFQKRAGVNDPSRRFSSSGRELMLRDLQFARKVMRWSSR